MCCMSGCSAGCWLTCIAIAIVWWLVASGLLLLAWNAVVVSLATVRKAKFWQALVVVLAVVVLFGPMCGGGACGGWCGYDCSHGCYSNCGAGCTGDCDYHKKSDGKLGCGSTCDPKKCDPTKCFGETAPKKGK